MEVGCPTMSLKPHFPAAAAAPGPLWHQSSQVATAARPLLSLVSHSSQVSLNSRGCGVPWHPSAAGKALQSSWEALQAQEIQIVSDHLGIVGKEGEMWDEFEHPRHLTK